MSASHLGRLSIVHQNCHSLQLPPTSGAGLALLLSHSTRVVVQNELGTYTVQTNNIVHLQTPTTYIHPHPHTPPCTTQQQRSGHALAVNTSYLHTLYFHFICVLTRHTLPIDLTTLVLRASSHSTLIPPSFDCTPSSPPPPANRSLKTNLTRTSVPPGSPFVSSLSCCRARRSLSFLCSILQLCPSLIAVRR